MDATLAGESRDDAQPMEHSDGNEERCVEDVDEAEDSEVKIEELDGEGNPVGEQDADDDDSANPQDKEIDRIDKEKKKMTPLQRLERATLWKTQGNDYFKKGETFNAADAYYHAVLYSRDLTQNPRYYPDIGHTDEQRQQAKDLCETSFANLALVQGKYGASLGVADPERRKVLGEAVKSSDEALKMNSKNVKALFRRGFATSALAKSEGVSNEKAQAYCNAAKADFLAVIEADSSNRDARVEVKAIQEHLKQLKREEIAGEKRDFSFASTLGGVGVKEKDILGDGSVRKLCIKTGDGGHWLNEDWLVPHNKHKCVIHVKCQLLSIANEAASGSTSKPVAISFVLGSPDIHDGLSLAVKSMTVGEVASFTMAPHRMSCQSQLAKMLPATNGQVSKWEVSFEKFAVWQDLGEDGSMLQKILSEGYGDFPRDFSEVHLHWKVVDAAGVLVHSSRYTVRIAQEGGIKHVEDEDKPAAVYVAGESLWEPLDVLCRSLRQGGVGELLMRRLPPLPQEPAGSGDSATAQLSMAMKRLKKDEELRHCIVHAEVERVVRPLQGPQDPRWEGAPSLVCERLLAEQLLEQGKEKAALSRLRRVTLWASELVSDGAAQKELAEARASIGWVLASRAAPILDLGTVRSDVLAAARQDIAEAEEQCVWLEQHHPKLLGTLLLRAKLLVAQDDDFDGAQTHLLEAQSLAPDDRRVQEELRKVKVELYKADEVRSRVKVVEIRDKLKQARAEGATDRVLELLRELSDTKVSWDSVMETRIGVELKCCQEACGEEARDLCLAILGRYKDESKEQRPMWAT